ncbi:MAG TPA: hypothetical protein EYG85_06135 [Crocinitomix sp.]|nr:hypothetical protein [Crocinitomix sp.]
MIKQYLFFASLIGIITSCQSKREKTTQQIIQEEVKHFFFMPDSTKIKVNITDTIFYINLLEQEKELDYKIGVIQHNIDTLGAYIHLWKNKMFELIDNQANECKINHAKLMYNTYLLSQKEFIIEKMDLMNTRRIKLGLKRFSNDSIMGYETDVTYFITDSDSSTLNVLMNANFKIVD